MLTEIPSTNRIHCFSGKDGRVNSVIVRGSRGTAVIDTQVTLEDGEELKRLAENLSNGKPILYVLITHEHFDHIAGNQFFKCEILSSRKARDEMLKGQRSIPGFVLTPPTITFETECQVSLGDLTLVMRHHGGHCPGESSVYIPEVRTLVSGDLVFHGSDPFVAFADITQWIHALTLLYMEMPQTVIPGHGAPGGPEILIEQRTYLEKFYEEIVEAKLHGIPADEAARRYCNRKGVSSQREGGFIAAAKRIYGVEQ